VTFHGSLVCWYHGWIKQTRQPTFIEFVFYVSEVRVGSYREFVGRVNDQVPRFTESNFQVLADQTVDLIQFQLKTFQPVKEMPEVKYENTDLGFLSHKLNSIGRIINWIMYA